MMSKDCLIQESGIDQKGIFSFDIGLVDPYSKLNCSINLHQKSFRYFKSKKPIFTILDPLKKMKKFAFQRIFQHGNTKINIPSSFFIPAELYKGNQSILPPFLNRLKKEKVDSFIKLNFTQQSKQFPSNLRQKCQSDHQTRRSKSLNIYYTKIKLNPEEQIKQTANFQQKQAKTRRFLDLQKMSPPLSYKIYRFQSVDSLCWKKKITPKPTLK